MPTEVQISLCIGSVLVLASSWCPPVYMPASSCQAVISVSWLNIFLSDLFNYGLQELHSCLPGPEHLG